MGWAVYRIDGYETHEGHVTIERLRRICATEAEAIDALYGNGLVRHMPGVKPTPECACGEPFYLDGDDWMRCYSCRASQTFGD